MNRDDRENHVFWAGFTALLLVGVFLGVRAHSAIQAVLGSWSRPAAAVARVGSVAETTAREEARRDSLVAAAPGATRDPFRPAPAASASPAGPAPRARAAPVAPLEDDTPVLRALLYDAVRPGVKIRVGSDESPWLYQGDAFSGWTVVEIHPNSAQFSKGPKKVYLYSS